MGNYSLANIFNREPVAIAGAVRSILYVLILMGAIMLDEKQLAGIALALEVVLGLFARGAVTPTAAPSLAYNADVLIEGTGDVPPADGIVVRKDEV